MPLLCFISHSIHFFAFLHLHVLIAHTRTHTHTYSKSIIASMHMNSTDTGKVSERMWGGGHYSTSHHITWRYMASFPATHLLAPFLTHRILHVLTCKRWFDSVIIADTLLHAVMHWREGYGFRCILSEYCHHRRFSAPFRYARCVRRK